MQPDGVVDGDIVPASSHGGILQGAECDENTPDLDVRTRNWEAAF